MRQVEKTGKTTEDAIQAALSELGLTREQVKVDVLEEESRGLLGIIGSRSARVRVTESGGREHVARQFLLGLLNHLGIKAEVSGRVEDSYIRLDISGDDLGVLIGRRGETLDAVQYLTNLAASRWASAVEDEPHVRVIVDAQGYRARREETLRGLAQRLSQRVKRSRRNLALEPMSPMDRRIIHTELQNDPNIHTHSEGEEPFRRVVISYVP